MAKSSKPAEWEDQAPRDYDPEEDLGDVSQDGSQSEESEDENAGTEHYVAVGKSKLRQKEGVSLGPQYRGTRISRETLEEGNDTTSEEFEDAQEELDSVADEPYDDPETADLVADQARIEEDVEIESDEAFAESDEEKLAVFVLPGRPKARTQKRAKAADLISSDEEGMSGEDEEDGGAHMDDEEESEDSGSDAETDLGGADVADDASLASDKNADDEDETGDSDAEQDEITAVGRHGRKTLDSRAEQRRMVSEGQKSLVATILDAAKQDAEKGLAIRQQRKTFDGLLNIRIRLQKALVATNSFSGFDGDSEQGLEPYEGAEQAALKLWNTLDSFRTTLLPPSLAQAGDKRKRAGSTSTTSQELWELMELTEERASKQRKKVLEHWSTKTNSTTVEVKSRNLMSAKQSIISGIEDQLLNSERLIKRTRTPRSCAPLQVAGKRNEDPEIYDDADFYQLMLKELVDQRTSEPSSAQAGSLAMVRWAAMKEAKTKKHVDRRASKGRKMRFNVHEKLQNFMAPEDRRSWEQDAIGRLFGTLFGQQMELNEEEVSDDEMNGIDTEEAGLKLFRS